MKYNLLCVVGFIVLLGILGANGAGECGKSTPDKEAVKLLPCVKAASDMKAPVSKDCCSAIHKMEQNPKCLCAVMYSNTAKLVGVKPGVAITIPKRCNLADRHIGYKCGPYKLP